MNPKNPTRTAIRWTFECPMNFLAGFAVFLAVLGTPRLHAGEPLVKKNARIAVVGDSITEAIGYSRMIETYLTACQPQLEAEVFQFGWSGERAEGFLKRMDKHLAVFEPSLVTLCYGMNDGSYQPYKPVVGEPYRKNLRQIVEKLKAQGKQVVVGGPGAVDPDFFKGNGKNVSPEDYNKTLAALSDIARGIAGENGLPHADVHGAMMDVIPKAKAVLGNKYHVCGGDGFHPDANGHFIMAYAFLKAMGFDGDLGAITLDFNGTSGAAGGHALKSFADGTATIESSRYPFCFKGPAESPSSALGILPHLPFNGELNRLTLVVKNGGAEKMKVTWGAGSRVFTKEQLEKGINLAAEFPLNPFSAPFENLDRIVKDKQAVERQQIKELPKNLAPIRQLMGQDTEAQAALDLIEKKMPSVRAAKLAAIREAFKPVVHTLKVEKAEQT